MARVRLTASAVLIMVLAFGTIASSTPVILPRLAATGVLSAVPGPSEPAHRRVQTGSARRPTSSSRSPMPARAPDLAGLGGVRDQLGAADLGHGRPRSYWSRRHLLLANSLGVQAATADATYWGWRQAAPSRCGLPEPRSTRQVGRRGERLRRGRPSRPRRQLGRAAAQWRNGNVVDTNDNAADFVANAAPSQISPRHRCQDRRPCRRRRHMTPTPTASPTPSPADCARRHPAPTALTPSPTDADARADAHADCAPTPRHARGDARADHGATRHRWPRLRRSPPTIEPTPMPTASATSSPTLTDG
jgi:hypothetical protein